MPTQHHEEYSHKPLICSSNFSLKSQQWLQNWVCRQKGPGLQWAILSGIHYYYFTHFQLFFHLYIRTSFKKIFPLLRLLWIAFFQSHLVVLGRWILHICHQNFLWWGYQNSWEFVFLYDFMLSPLLIVNSLEFWICFNNLIFNPVVLFPETS